MAEWQITFWDVGQGDATDIKLPDNTHIVIDAGPPANSGNPFPLWFSDSVVGKPRIRCLVLTHTHRDHFGGAIKLCIDDQQIIDEVILPLDANVRKIEDIPIEDKEDLPELRKLFGLLCNRRGTRVVRYKSPGIIYEDEDLRLRAVAPLKMPSDSPMSINRTSIILALESVHRPERTFIVWSGDTLLSELGKNITNSIEGVLTGPHHGRPQDMKPNEPPEKTGFFMQILRNISPQTLFISVGTKNQYEHPFRKYLAAAANAGVRVCCSELTKRCKEKCNEDVYPGSAMLGLQPPQNAIQCRGTMRVFVSTHGGLRYDQCQKEFLENVVTKVPKGACNGPVLKRPSKANHLV